MWKLMKNIKSRYLKKIAFSPLSKEEEGVYRGGAMCISAIITAIKQGERTAQASLKEKIDKESGLDMIGW